MEIAFREKAGPSSMDVDHGQYQSGCKKGIGDSKTVAECTHPHDYHEEQFQQKSLSIDAAVPDPGSKRENQEYGICKSPILKSTSSLMANALEGSSSEDADHAQYQSISSTSFMTDDFNERPKFINAARLKKLYGCAICKDVVVQPHQTSCGNRVCKKCIEEKFGSLSVIKCPLPHDDMDEEELKKEQCQQEGRSRYAVVPDYISQQCLLKEKCFCENQEYGCCENPPWKKLKEHLGKCDYAVFNHLAAATVEKEKLEDCLLEESANERKNEDRKLEIIREKTHPDHLLHAGSCYYLEYCSFQTENLGELRHHMKSKVKQHLNAIEKHIISMKKTALNNNLLKINDPRRIHDVGQEKAGVIRN